MNTRSFSYSILLIAGAALTGCAADDPDSGTAYPSESGNPIAASRIEIFGGSPSEAISTRAVNPPAQPGVCDADRCRIWFYEGEVHNSSLSYPSIGASGVQIVDSVTVKAERYADDYAKNKLASCLRDFRAKTHSTWLYHYSAAAVASLAYEEQDLEKFTTDAKGRGKDFSSLTLSLNGTETPDLYFGHLKFPVYTDKKDAEGNPQDMMAPADDDVFYYYHNDMTQPLFTDCPVNGKLFRIVSMIKINIDDVPEGEIERLEMFVSNLPTRMTLFGNHGAFYPVSAADSHIGAMDEPEDTDSYVLIASTDHLHQGASRLSAYLLPSQIGRKLMVRIHFPATRRDENGNPMSPKDCFINPPASVFLQGDDAEVYFNGASEKLRNGKDLFVYNATEEMFYSYSNVRININGKFDNIFREITPVGIRVEVCPTYQKEHVFDFE